MLGRMQFFFPPFLFSGSSGCFKFTVSLFEYLFLSTFQFVLRGNVADRTVQSFFVVMDNIGSNLVPGFLKGECHLGANAFVLNGFVETFQFAVALRVEWRGPNMSHTCHPDKRFEVLGDELRAVVGYDPGGCLREFLPGPL